MLCAKILFSFFFVSFFFFLIRLMRENTQKGLNDNNKNNNSLTKISKYLIKGLEELKNGGQVETTQMTALLRSARILRGVLPT